MDLEIINEISSTDLYVAGVGASAGGLDAISKFLNGLHGNDENLAVVIVMHLSPDYKSELTSILKKRSRWPVITAEDGDELQPRHIYVTPPNKNIKLKGDAIRLEPLPESYATAPSIDQFFESLASELERKSIGVVLSGFGHDGTDGLKTVREKGGFTIAQLPDTAEHGDMPTSAIKARVVEKVLPPEHMFQDIQQFIHNSETLRESKIHDKSIDAIFDLLERRSGTNFAYYKPSTILRRINLRMSSLHLESLNQYYELLKAQPVELDKLFETVLIGVTEFFRDQNAFDGLREQLEKLVADKKHGDPIRIWSVGCASGEEPYSLAILLNEILGRDISKYQVQIFASDIDEGGLGECRKGIYNEEGISNIPASLVEKYFHKKGESYYEIKKTIKQHILFTRHDITKDPPFVKLDLIVCRNLLIYFNNQLQKQTFQVFHYALRPKGLLLLGKSESTSVVPGLFSKLNNQKLFQKSDQHTNYQLKFSRYLHSWDSNNDHKENRNSRNISLVDAAKESLYHQYEHPFVVITQDAEIREVHGSLRLYMEIGEGAMNANIFKMANKELVPTLQALTAQVKRTGVPHTSQILKFNLYDTDHWVRVKIVPLLYPVNKMEYFMVIFMKVEETDHLVKMQQKLETTDLVNYRIRELEDELATTKEHLQIFTEELEATNEELQTMNEELQSSNEELKSSNEELETSNEELQSANEELNTANYELRLTNEALIEKEEELRKEKENSEHNEQLYKLIAQNIPNGTVGILNDQLEIEYIAGRRLNKFKIKPDKDLGRKLPDLLATGEQRENLYQVFNKTLKGESGNIVFSYGDNYYDLQTVPVKFSDNQDLKIMYLTQDITEEKRQELKLNMTLKASDVILYEYDYKKERFKKNSRLNKLFEYPANKVLTREMVLDRFHPDDLEKRNKLVRKLGSDGKISYETRLNLKEGTKWIRVIGNVLFDADGNPDVGVAAIQDITKDKILLQKVKERQQRFQFIADSTPAMIWIGDKDMNCTYLNNKWLEFTGRELQECMGKGWIKSVHPDDKGERERHIKKAYQEVAPVIMEYRLLHDDGNYRHILDHGVPITDSSGNLEGFMGSCVDITRQKNFTRELEKSVAERTTELERSNQELLNLNINLEQYAYAASHDLQEPLRKIQTFISMIKEDPDDLDRAKKYFAKIEKASERMRTLVQDILNYNSIKEEAKKQEVDLDELLGEIESDLGLLLKEKNGQIISQPLGKIPAVRSQVYQLLVNLLKNSIIYNENEPRIHISREIKKGKDIEVQGVIEDATYHCFSVSDNGIGFDQEKFSYLVKPFKRSHSRGSYPGSGLGLAICERIISIHNGVWGVTSRVGYGTSFTICLPLEELED